MGSETNQAFIERGVIEAIESLVDRDVVIDPTTTFAELGLDSLALVELALTLEQRWPIELRADDYDAVHTVGDVVALVAGQVR
jgi:acyl carrier protein